MSAGAGTTFLVTLLGAAVLVALIGQRLRIPSAAALVFAGALVTAIHPIALPFTFGDTLLFVFLPPLIFEAAWNIDLAVLRRVAVRVALLAVPGVAFVALAVAGAVAAGGGVPFASALVLGAIVSATDPVAVIAIFRRLPVPADLHMLVEGESLANDGVAIALYGIALSLASTAAAPSTIAMALGHGVVAIAGGIVVGLILAAIVAVVVGSSNDSAFEVTATVVLAFLAYVVADALSLSGVFATAAAGIGLRAIQQLAPVTEKSENVDSFWAALAFIVNAFVFLFTGLTVQVARIGHEPWLVAIALGAALAARVALAALVSRTFAWRATIVLAGMRGGLSLALALAIPAAFPYRAQIIDATFAIVLFTLVVQGVALEPVLRRLRF